VTRTTTVTVTKTSTSYISTYAICATVTTSVSAVVTNCRRRRQYWIDVPVYIALDEELDDQLTQFFNINPSNTYPYNSSFDCLFYIIWHFEFNSIQFSTGSNRQPVQELVSRSTTTISSSSRATSFPGSSILAALEFLPVTASRAR
jgi:hypothetical protein